MTTETEDQVFVNGATYTIVDDYGPVYVVLCEESDGRRTYNAMTPHPKWGKHPILGERPFGDVFPANSMFGIATMHTAWAYSHRDYSRWKHFLGFSLYHERRSQHARSMANSVARKYLAQLDAVEIEAVIR